MSGSGKSPGPAKWCLPNWSSMGTPEFRSSVLRVGTLRGGVDPTKVHPTVEEVSFPSLFVVRVLSPTGVPGLMSFFSPTSSHFFCVRSQLLGSSPGWNDGE